MAGVDYEIRSIKIAPSGNIYYCANDTNVYKRAPNGTITTWATAVDFYGITIDAAENVFGIHASYSGAVKKIDTSQNVTTIVEGGFFYPMGICINPATGNLYVADTAADRIALVTQAGVVSTFATGMGHAFRITRDASGNFYTAGGSNTNNIFKISPDGSSVTLLAGSGTAGFADGLGAAASFNYPAELVVDALVNVYVADAGNNRIRKITPAGLVTTLAGN
jgi:DNA-binding beta-propeller fold protein YncE